MDPPGSLSPVDTILAGRRPSRVVYSPNYWQWFAHHRNHGSLPPALIGCRSQLEMLGRLGVDVFSRNLYCDEQRGWFGGLAEEVWNGVTVTRDERLEGRDRLIARTYATRRGTLTERQRYVYADSTLVQEQFALTDPESQWDAIVELVQARRWRFLRGRFQAVQAEVGSQGLVVAGELFSPLKLLHLLAGAVNASFVLLDQPARAQEVLAVHEAAQLDLVRQMTEAGVRVMMAMDNLDSAFHPPALVERFSASFYEKASRLCHQHGSRLLIHACGRQKANLRLIDSLGVDGLEGVAPPPLGDVDLAEALAATSDRFIVTGGITPLHTRELTSRTAVFVYVRDLLARLEPWAHRFVFGSSCNTAIDARWETLEHFRDAWTEYGSLG